MATVSSTYFHGASGDTILKIIASGQLRPGTDNTIYLGRYNWESCMMHGPDRKRKASFVIKVAVGQIPEQATIFRETHGVRDTAVIQTDQPIPVDVLELYVRKFDEDRVASLDRILGAEAIKQYLGPARN